MAFNKLRIDAQGRVAGGVVVEGTYIDPYEPEARTKPEMFEITKP